MIYLFRKFNKQIIAVRDRQAWELYSSNGDWKYRPIYLGVVGEEAYRNISEQVKAETPIEGDLFSRVNTGEDRGADRELQPLMQKRKKRETELLEELATKADKTQTPPNMDLINKDQIPREYHGMARNLMSHE